MHWMLAVKGAITRLRQAPFTETPISDVHSVVYKIGVETIPNDGTDQSQGEAGTFSKGLYRGSGFLFTFESTWADNLLSSDDPIDLIINYLAEGSRRKRTLVDIIFCGDAVITIPDKNIGLPELIGIPFRMQIPPTQNLSTQIIDEVDNG